MKYAVILLSLFFASCSAPKKIMYKGSYSNAPIEIKTEKSFDEVWSNLIDVFAQKGLSIKIIDKSSGLIVSERSKLNWTYELKTGQLKDSSAFIVVPLVFNPNNRMTAPEIGYAGQLTGEWNVRVKNVNGQTVINVNIVNVEHLQYNISSRLADYTPYSDYHTTGVFERKFSDLIK